MEPSGIVVSPYLRDLQIRDVMVDAGGRGMAYKAYDAEEQCFFIKAFARPKIMKDLVDDAMLADQAQICAAFEVKQENLYMQSSKAQFEDDHLIDELVRFRDFFPYRGVYYTVFDYIEQAGSGDLASSGLPTKVFVLADAAAALTRLHAFGIFHGDVKPGNILIYQGVDDRPGKEGQRALRGKLIDYDGGCLIDNPPPLQHGLLDYDDVYASPDFVRFIKRTPGVTLTTGMDVFALSMTAARMLVGQLPMDAVDGLAAGADPTTLLSLNDLPPPIAAIIARGLSLDPASRPTASEMHDTFSQWLGRRATARHARQPAPTWYDPQAAMRNSNTRRSAQHESQTPEPTAPRARRGPRLEGYSTGKAAPVKPTTSLTDD